MALLEADVHLRVVKPFIDRVRERALGQEVLESLTPAQQVVKIVRDELSALLGEEGTELRLDGRPTVIMLCGLQGSGKTTTAGKIAKRLKKRGKHPLLVAGDLQRAAAVEQLKQVGKGVDVPVLEPEPGENVVDLGARALSVARQRGHDVVLMDTAGRLHVDTALMDEIRRLADAHRAPRDPLRGRLDDRPGRRQERRAVRPGAAADRRHPHQARRRLPRRRGAVDPHRRPGADPLRGHR